MSEHRLPRAYVLGLRIFGPLALLLGATLVLASLFADWGDDRAEVPLVAAFVGGVFVLLGGWLWRAARRAPRMAVAVDDTGLRSLDPGRPQPTLGWGEVQGAVPRFLGGRLDVLRPYGEPLRLVYQLERFDELMATFMDRAAAVGRARPRPARFGWRLSPVEIGDRELALGRRRFPLSEVRRPFLHVWKDGRGNAVLQLWVSLEGSRSVALGVRQAELFDAYRTLEAALAGQRA